MGLFLRKKMVKSNYFCIMFSDGYTHNSDFTDRECWIIICLSINSINLEEKNICLLQYLPLNSQISITNDELKITSTYKILTTFQ